MLSSACVASFCLIVAGCKFSDFCIEGNIGRASTWPKREYFKRQKISVT
jgi:hypothetical protein